MYMLGACLTEECFSSLADILSIADVIRLVVFLHFLLCF